MSGFVKISLTKGKYALVDQEDVDFISQWKWSLSGCGRYAVRGDLRGKMIYMHRALVVGEHEHVDHKNHDGLDNRRENLRGCTRSENFMNRQIYTFSKYSRFKGVTLHTDGRKNPWTAKIKKDKRTRNLGSFDNEIDAARAYNVAALNLFGEFAYLNEIEAQA